MFGELKDTINTEHITLHNFLVGNTVGRILLSLEEKYTEEIKRLFNKNYKEIYHPYIFFRKNNLWSKNISKLAFYMIALYIKCSSIGNNKILKGCVAKYHEVKKGHYHLRDEELKEILKQIS